MAACRRLGMQLVPARLVPSSTTPAALAALAIADNALQRPLHLMEQARAYGLILAVADSEEERLHLAAQTGLAANTAIMKKSARLLTLPDFIQAGIISQTLSLATALDLGALDPEAARILVGIFEQLKLGLNKQREVLTLATEICRREEFSLEALFQEAPLHAALANPDWDRNRKTHLLRTYLRQRRFPEISRAENEFADLRKGLKLGPGMKLSAPRHFEGLVYTLTLFFQNEAQLADHRTTLERILADPRLAKILSRK
jgi:ParB family chromosome partitioning protein